MYIYMRERESDSDWDSVSQAVVSALKCTGSSSDLHVDFQHSACTRHVTDAEDTLVRNLKQMEVVSRHAVDVGEQFTKACQDRFARQGISS